MSDSAAAIQPTVHSPPPGETVVSHDTFALLARTQVEVQPVLPGYRLLRQIAQGGMGTVWLAEHAALQRTVALKVMRPELARDRVFVERFVREARAAARVSHPGVVGVHDAGIAGSHLYLAMEYVPGGDLAARIERGRLSEAEAVALMGPIADALQAIHDAGLVHRDLKPDNILLDEQGCPKIADLGLARASEGDDRMTATGQALGTPAYMSPEQANGASDLDARSDVYSLAATLYALVTGTPPFTGPTPWATVAKVINDPPPDPRRINPALSNAFANAILRALAKDRNARQPSAQAFVADLQAAPGVDALALPAPRWWRNRWLVGIGGSYLAVAAIGLAASLALMPARRTGAISRAALTSDAEPVLPASRPAPALVTLKVADQAPADVPGTVLDAIDGRFPTVHRAVMVACERNGLALGAERLDAAGGTVAATFADGNPVRVTLREMAPGTTQLAVRIGRFGDESRSRLLLGWIRDEL